MKYLIDTDWLIDHLSGVKIVERKLEDLALEAFLPGISILSIDEEICRIFGKERGRLRKQGQIIGDLDLFIAAISLHHNLTLLTNNVSHFGRIENLRIISL